MIQIKYPKITIIIIFVFLSTIIASCQENPPQAMNSLRVVSTTTIVADVVAFIGGDTIDQTVLLSPGVDPHSFDPAPKDVAAIVDADLVFANGAGLEEFLEPILVSADANEKVVYVSEGIDLLQPIMETKPHSTEDEDHEHDEDEDEEDDHHHGADPHTWTDPNNIYFWVDNILNALVLADPQNAVAYETNAAAYRAQLAELDIWVKQQIDQIPPENREIVTDHQIFGYFARRYGLTQVGAIIPSFSTAAGASANELANLQEDIKALDTKAIFIGNTVNPDLANQISQDTGTTLNFIFTGSLSDPQGDAPTYIEYIRYNTITIVNALR